MSKVKFKKGDRVICSNDYDSLYNVHGKVGTVLDESAFPFVEFDEYVGGATFTKKGHSVAISQDKLELYIEPKLLAITHEKWGTVVGVDIAAKNVEYPYHVVTWEKYEHGRKELFFYSDGWREKVEEQREEVVLEKWRNKMGDTFMCGSNQRLRWVELYDLPENWENEWFKGCITLGDYVQQYKKPRLILERKVRS